MAVTNTSVGFVDMSALDVSASKESLKTFLKNQDRFKDYNFEGSDVNVMLDLLAVNHYRHAFLLNMVGSEMFQDTAQLRESAVSHAKELNYLPRSRTSATTLVNISVSPTDAPAIVVIPKFYSLVSQSVTTNETYVFSTAETITIRNNGGQYVGYNIPVFEGRVVTEYFVADTNTRYLINSANVDISSIDVNVQNSIADTGNTTFFFADSLYGLTNDTPSYFLQGADAEKYEIVFGNGVTGRKINAGNVVKVTYRDSSGPNGNGLTRFSPAGTINGYTNIVVTLAGNQASTGGAEKEAIESIKFNAPRHYATQGNAVTDTDYSTLILQKFPTIESLTVFGGEKLAQKKYGKVVICAKPYNGQYISDGLKNQILEYIRGLTSVSIDPIFINAEYFYLEPNISVYYDPNITSLSPNDIVSRVIASVKQYEDDHLNDFTSDFRFSRLTNYIDNADGSIVSNNTKTRIIKRYAPPTNIEVTTSFTFASPLMTNRTDAYAIESSFFTYTYSDVDYYVRIRDDGKGKLNVYKTVNNAETVLDLGVGSVDYKTGAIQLTSLNIKDYVGYINIYARTQDRDFIISRNQMLLVDAEDINVTVLNVTT
jgi:hypothetical protein